MSASNIVSQNIVSVDPQKDDAGIPCERCGEPATIHVEQTVLCSVCYLKKTGGRIIQLDHTGYYP